MLGVSECMYRQICEQQLTEPQYSHYYDGGDDDGSERQQLGLGIGTQYLITICMVLLAAANHSKRYYTTLIKINMQKEKLGLQVT